MEQVVLDFLKQKMVDNNETFKTLEDSVGISDSTLSKWYAGKGEISTYGLTRLAQHYGYSSLCEFFVSIPLANVPQDKQQDVDIVLRIIDECNADKDFQKQHCQILLEHQQELRRMDQDRYEALARQKDEYHGKITSYLKAQVSRFRTTTIIFAVSLVLILFIDSPDLVSAVNLSQANDGGLIVLRVVTLCLLLLLLGIAAWLLISANKSRKPTNKDGSAQS